MSDDNALEAAARALTPVLHGSQEDEHGDDLPDVQFDHLPPDWQARHIEYAQACITAYLTALEAAGMVVVPVETVELLRRYREETPPKHSPHLICSKADRVLDLIAASKGEG